ncbi:hypothetical protein BJY52DRAFT_745598 [Lactarius psammicola]|nr:hypothetical protein BJY52DRAFT_745598 [Lactarius psammicola]
MFENKFPHFDRNRTYARSLHFLVTLFQREFMTDGQAIASVGGKRRKSYEEIVNDVEIRTNPGRTSIVTTNNISPEDEDEDESDKLPSVFIAFDEAYSLTQPIELHSNQNYFIELHRALQALGTPLFSLFLPPPAKSRNSRYREYRLADNVQWVSPAKRIYGSL